MKKIELDKYKKIPKRIREKMNIYFNISGSIIYKNQLIGIVKDNDLEIWNEKGWIKLGV